VSVGELIRSALIAAFVAALVGGAARVLGLDGPHALAVGGGVLAVVLVLLAQRSVVPPAELLPPDLDPSVGGRRDVEQLAWSLVEHRTHVRGVVLARVRLIAEHRLAEHGFALQRREDAAAIESLLGSAAWAVLRPDRDRPVSPRALDTALLGLERLPPPGPLGPARTIQTDRISRAD
jgi:hypothetical protein